EEQPGLRRRLAHHGAHVDDAERVHAERLDRLGVAASDGAHAGEVHHRVGGEAAQGVAEGRGVEDVDDAPEALAPGAGWREYLVADGEQMIAEVATDEAVGAGDQDAHDAQPFTASTARRPRRPSSRRAA